MVLSLWQQRRWPEVERELARVVERLRPLDPDKVVLFGSHARGDFHEHSDIDLVVVMRTQQRYIDRVGDVLTLLDCRDFDIEPHVYTPEEYENLKRSRNALVEAAEREGKVLYERGR